MIKLEGGRKEQRAFLGSLCYIESISLIQLSTTPKLWRKAKQQSPCLYPIPQHCHPFPSKIQEPQGIGMICLTCDYEATKGDQIYRQDECSPCFRPQRGEARPPPCLLHYHSIILSFHLSQCTQILVLCTPNGIYQELTSSGSWLFYLCHFIPQKSIQ